MWRVRFVLLVVSEWLKSREHSLQHRPQTDSLEGRATVGL